VIVPLAEIPELAVDDLRDVVLAATADKGRLVALFGLERSAGRFELYAVLADDGAGSLKVFRSALAGRNYSSLTHHCPQAHYFEREIAEQLDITPEGHPALKPVRKLNGWNERFFRVDGEEVHEVGVGPVHAGVIEPGHFRFQCHGERVFHLEIALGYQHRGIEQALVGGPHRLTMAQMETIAGDSTIGHGLAFCLGVEALTGATPSPRADAIRAVALECERIANHVGDLGALSADVGYLPVAALCGKLRGDCLNLTAALCGNRFGRGLLCPGGVLFDVDGSLREQLRRRLESTRREVERAIRLLWSTPSVLARFEGAGVIHRLDCRELGFVGPAARACGLERDVRASHPHGAFVRVPIELAVAHHGDVASRAMVRRLEIEHSLAFLEKILVDLPAGELRAPVGALAPDSLAVSLVEGWRGEICHVALTDGEGRFRRYKIIDPSFHNWFALALAMRGGQISDFPLCNKSFNLSYCGHDL
jgi:Ni,Fe-hydrogenase III large subunit